MMLRKIAMLVVIIGGLSWIAWAQVSTHLVPLVVAQATELPPRQIGEIPVRPDLIFDAQPGPDVDTLQQITGGAQTNAEALARIAAYYEEQQARLATLWREDHSQRLAALFAMYATHISQPYGEVPEQPQSLLEFMGQERGHCGTYAIAQAEIASALGLTWRQMTDAGWHTWVEVAIDGQWEVFDSTVNVWLDQPVDELVLGGPRQYRLFYTPMTDIDRLDARLHLQEGPYGYNMPNLRMRVLGYGIYWWPLENVIDLVATNQDV